MQPFVQLAQQHPLIALHLVCAVLALVAGGIVLARRKGTFSHRVLGWSFVVLLGGATLTSAFIRDAHFPNIAGYTPIHVLTVVTAIFLPLGVWRIRTGQVDAHRRTMTRLYIGACIVAGLFTLLPGRFLGNLVWQQGPGL
jgi:uncharacterized membrane protein